MNTISLCRFPTKVLVIDDDALSLNKLDLNLDDSRFTYQFHNNPQDTLAFLTNEYKPDSFTKRLVSQPDENKWQHAMLDINIYDLMNEIYNPKRFEQISAIIVDFAMPGMNGLELCEKIKDPSIHKILLTGEGDEHLAVQAFNKGLIHRYIKKQDPNVFKILNQSLLETQGAYFSKISKIMFEAATFNPEISCILDPVFINFFEALLREKNIVEYYLFEITGNFLLLDEDMNAYGLFVYNQSILDMWNEDFPQIDEAPSYLIKEMRDYQKMICFHNKDTFQIPSGQEWEKYSYPLNRLEGEREPYFYACEKNMVDIESDKILSFRKFKNKGLNGILP